jgi:hypothetical protein
MAAQGGPAGAAGTRSRAMAAQGGHAGAARTCSAAVGARTTGATALAAVSERCVSSGPSGWTHRLVCESNTGSGANGVPLRSRGGRDLIAGLRAGGAVAPTGARGTLRTSGAAALRDLLWRLDHGGIRRGLGGCRASRIVDVPGALLGPGIQGRVLVAN